MINERRVVQKNEFEPLRTVWLKHNPALFTEDEWIWTEHASEAFIFQCFDAAEAAKDLLVANGESHVHTFPHYEDKRAGLGDVSGVIHAQSPKAKVSSTECFEALEKRNLA